MPRVMIDLETLGTRPGCSVLSIGAAEFSPDGVKASFYVVVRRSSCLDAGLVEDPDTVVWWGRQSPEARTVLTEAADPLRSVPLGHARHQFDFWLGQVVGEADVPRKTLTVSWNGPDFDL